MSHIEVLYIFQLKDGSKKEFENKFIEKYKEYANKYDINKIKYSDIAKDIGYTKTFDIKKFPAIKLKIKQINRAMELELSNIGINKAKIINELYKIAKADVRKIVNEDGSIKSLDKIDDEYLAMAISEISFYNNGQIKSIKLLDKIKSFELISKHLGLLVEIVEVSDSIAEKIIKARERLEKAKPIIINADAECVSEPYHDKGYFINKSVVKPEINDIANKMKEEDIINKSKEENKEEKESKDDGNTEQK